MRLPTQLLKRKPSSHKGDFGHIFILAGSLRFSGAALICAEAALRSGAGLVTLGIPSSLAGAVIKRKINEVMLLPLPETKEQTLSLKGFNRIQRFLERCDVLAVGPGLSTNNNTQALVCKILREVKKPVIVDADALNALIGKLGILPVSKEPRTSTILTPHPGEMARLLGLSVEKIQANRDRIAREFAEKYKLVVVLKGHHTVVAGSHGKLYVNLTGNPGMATAGSGDCLTGMIAAFLGQGLCAFDASKFAVYLHGLAGDIAAKEKTEISLIASDIIAKIPKAIKLSAKS